MSQDTPKKTVRGPLSEYERTYLESLGGNNAAEMSLHLDDALHDALDRAAKADARSAHNVQTGLAVAKELDAALAKLKTAEEALEYYACVEEQPGHYGQEATDALKALRAETTPKEKA